MKVLFYGPLADAIGPELELNAAPGSSVAAIRDALIARHPQVEDVLRNKRARACVDQMIVHEDYVPGASDTLEFLPPVSGG